jgi:hypothetical protein
MQVNAPRTCWKGEALYITYCTSLIRTATLAFLDSSGWKWIYAENKMTAQQITNSSQHLKPQQFELTAMKLIPPQFSLDNSFKVLTNFA